MGEDVHQLGNREDRGLVWAREPQLIVYSLRGGRERRRREKAGWEGECVEMVGEGRGGWREPFRAGVSGARCCPDFCGAQHWVLVTVGEHLAGCLHTPV